MNARLTPDPDPLWQEVAPGILRLSLPVPFVGLRQVNLWLLRDGDGWLMIDCGWSDAATHQRLRQIWSEALQGRPITRLLLTHFHPDHIGNCRFICETWGLTPLASRAEWLAAEQSLRLGLLDDLPAQAEFFRRHGLSAALAQRYLEDFLPYDRGVGLAADFTPLAEGDRLQIDGRDWQVMTGGGHSPEMVMLHAPEAGLFIAGDQLLAKISSNVSVGHFAPEADPLQDYLTSLARLQLVLDPETLVLGSHRSPFTQGPNRAAELCAHHADRLQAICHAVQHQGEATAAALLPVLFTLALDGYQLGFAMGEVIAHLNHLVVQGRLQRVLNPDGTIVFRTA